MYVSSPMDVLAERIAFYCQLRTAMKQRVTHLFLALLALPVWLAAATSPYLPPMTAQMQWKGRIVVEFKETLEPIRPASDASGIIRLGNVSLDALARQYNVYNIEKFIPWSQKPLNPDIPDLSRLYIIEFPPDIDLHAVALAYGADPSVITAEPYQIHQQVYLPNDPNFNQQWGLTAIHATQAYDYNRGETPVIIGIVDSGTDTAHEDLRDNLWVNPGEDLNHNGVIELTERNGIDNDQNGKIDDFWGWNFMDGGNNNVMPYLNPGEPQAEAHGTHCAGDANGRTDNGLGIASPGCQAKIMTVRAGVGNSVIFGIQGISYCAANDARIISLSWGNYFYSSYEQAVINEAWAQGSIVVAAAGNDNTTSPFYPAAYQNVVTVAATSTGDHKASFSNFGSWIDVCTPGDDIFSTYIQSYGTAYGSMSGTSMACPITAGAIALIWSVDTSRTKDQVVDILYNTCTNIDALNPNYAGLLGHGRIDIGAAMTSMYPNLSMTQTAYLDPPPGNNDGRPDPGETVDMVVSLQNSSLVNTAVGVTAIVTSTDPYLTFLQSGSSYGNIQPNTTQTNAGNPMRFMVDELAPVHVCTLDVTINSQSLQYPIQTQVTQMIGRPEVLLVSDDGAANYSNWYKIDLDSLGVLHDIWDVYLRGEISQSEATLYKNVIWQTSNATNPLSENEQSLIQYYLSHGGRLFLIGENIDEELAGTTFYSDVLRCISNGAGQNYALTGVQGNVITEGTSLFLTGGNGAGNSQSPASITPVNGAISAYTYANSNVAGLIWQDGNNGLVYFAFNFEAASGVAQTTARRIVLNNILNWFNSIQGGVLPQAPGTPEPTVYDLKQNYPNPFNPTTDISYDLPRASHVKLTVWDLNGRLVTTLVNNQEVVGRHRVTFAAGNLATGVYLYRLEAEGATFTRKMVLIK
jgi:subtilisin family serine protease